MLLSCEEEGMLTQDPNVNAQPCEVRRSIRLNVANETMQTQRGMVIWSLRDPSAAIIREESVRIEAGPLSSLWLDKVELPEAGLFENYVSFRLEADGEILSSGSVLFCAPKYFAFRDPCLQVRAEGEELVVTADAYARSVESIMRRMTCCWRIITLIWMPEPDGLKSGKENRKGLPYAAYMISAD